MIEGILFYVYFQAGDWKVCFVFAASKCRKSMKAVYKRSGLGSCFGGSLVLLLKATSSGAKITRNVCRR